MLDFCRANKFINKLSKQLQSKCFRKFLIVNFGQHWISFSVQKSLRINVKKRQEFFSSQKNNYLGNIIFAQYVWLFWPRLSSLVSVKFVSHSTNFPPLNFGMFKTYLRLALFASLRVRFLRRDGNSLLFPNVFFIFSPCLYKMLW